MRGLASIAIAAWLAPAVVRAESAAQLAARGEELAKQGRLTDAIDTFKAADRSERRARHACLIALAYVRRELWPQAEVWMALCHERATASDPLPDWVALADQQLAERLVDAKVAAVKIRVEPAALANRAQITVSSFAPDEQFAPRTIHLPPGKHLVTAIVDGRTAQEAIEIDGRGDREVVLRFIDVSENRTPAAAAPAKRPRQLVPLIVTGAGAALVMGGGAYHLFAFKPTRDALADANAAGDTAAYDRHSSKFDGQRATTIALYAGGAALFATGIVLRYTLYRDRPERAPRAAIDAGRERTVVTMEWRR